ncbi:NAD(P)/FAD-dependent oxidoreductase [Sphingomonas sp.]|uniref:NAD(P)/FAD-dependent oxidoreductase n=1 Tax=Sphingomonas sp. TaxID=28214 RepID=UPI0035AE6350
MRRTPALIVGGGPAGAAAAITLTRAGMPHLLVERQRVIGDALCGGFLSWRTVAQVRALGVEPGGHRVTRLRMVTARAVAEAPLPEPAIGLSRHRLDTILLAQAEAVGARVERGVSVRAVEHGGVRLADGEVLAPDVIFLATGKHDLRGAPARGDPGDDPALGLRVRLAAAPGLSALVDDAIELHLFDRGYAGLVLQEDGSANLCMAVRRSRLRAAGDAAGLLAELAREVPRLGERLAFMAGDAAVDAVANVPYGWRARPGALFRLGDQAGVIPSLAGEGMGIALASGVSAAQSYIAGGAATAPDWQRAFRRRIGLPIAVAGGVRALAEGRARGVLPRLAGPALVRWIARVTRAA